MTLDYLHCKEHFEEIADTHGNKWILESLKEQGDTQEFYYTNKCELNFNGKKCNKEGYAIVHFKQFVPNGVLHVVSVCKQIVDPKDLVD